MALTVRMPMMAKVVGFMPMYPDPAPPVDRDRCRRCLFQARLHQLSHLATDIPTALSWGPINSMSVVQHIGAQEGLLTQDQLLNYLSKAPENYKAEQII